MTYYNQQNPTYNQQPQQGQPAMGAPANQNKGDYVEPEIVDAWLAVNFGLEPGSVPEYAVTRHQGSSGHFLMFQIFKPFKYKRGAKEGQWGRSNRMPINMKVFNHLVMLINDMITKHCPQMQGQFVFQPVTPTQVNTQGGYNMQPGTPPPATGVQMGGQGGGVYQPPEQGAPNPAGNPQGGGFYGGGQ